MGRRAPRQGTGRADPALPPSVKPTATQEEMDEALAGSVHGRQVFAEAVSFLPLSASEFAGADTRGRRSLSLFSTISPIDSDSSPPLVEREQGPPSLSRCESPLTLALDARKLTEWHAHRYRNEELREIERTMGECAQLMNDVSLGDTFPRARH